MLWVSTPYSFVGGYQHFDGTWYLHLQGRKSRRNSTLQTAIVGSSEALIITNKSTRCHNINCHRFENIEFKPIGILLLALNERPKRNKEHEASIHTQICSNAECTRTIRKQATNKHGGSMDLVIHLRRLIVCGHCFLCGEVSCYRNATSKRHVIIWPKI